MPDQKSAELAAVSDSELVLRTRAGESSAFGELWSRHYQSGMSAARSVTSKIDPDDLVQEAYTRILHAIQRGGGPNGSFRAYLLASIRNTAASWGRANRESVVDELDTLPDPDSTEESLEDALDHSLTVQAFRGLPTRWQEVLWYTEVEQMRPSTVAPLLGMSSGAVSQLAFRAREGLREAWVQAHLNSATADSECRWTIDSLGAYARGNLSARDRKRVDEHLHECARCMIVAAEAKDVSGRLAMVLLPLVLGAGGAGAYLATLQGAAAGASAAVAMPEGFAFAEANGLDALGGSTSAVGGAGAGLGGVGVLIGAGALAVIGAVVTAALVIPSIFSPPTSSENVPQSSDSDSAMTAEIGPDPDSSPHVQPSETEPAIEDPPEAPTDPPPAPSVPPPPAPEPPIGPEPEPEPPIEPEEPTVLPEDPLVIDGTPTVDCVYTVHPDSSVTSRTHYYVPVAGDPGWSVQAYLESDTANAVEIVLDGAGIGEIDLEVMFAQVYLNVPVTFHYLHEGTIVGDSTVMPLHTLADPWSFACGSDVDDPPPVPTEDLALVFDPPIILSCHAFVMDPDPDVFVNYFSIAITGAPGFGVFTFIGSDVANAVHTVLDASGTAVVTVHPTTPEIENNVLLTFHYDLYSPSHPSAITFALFDTGSPGSDACPD